MSSSLSRTWQGGQQNLSILARQFLCVCSAEVQVTPQGTNNPLHCLVHPCSLTSNSPLKYVWPDTVTVRLGNRAFKHFKTSVACKMRELGQAFDKITLTQVESKTWGMGLTASMERFILLSMPHDPENKTRITHLRIFSSSFARNLNIFENEDTLWRTIVCSTKE